MGGHRVLLREEELELKHPALERGVLGPSDHHAEVPKVILLGLRADPGRGLAHETLGLLGEARERRGEMAGAGGVNARRREASEATEGGRSNGARERECFPARGALRGGSASIARTRAGSARARGPREGGRTAGVRTLARTLMMRGGRFDIALASRTWRTDAALGRTGGLASLRGAI